MANTIKRHITHIKSSGGTGPLAEQIEFGEIAVGYKEGSEALYIKNSSGEVVSFTTSSGGQAMSELYTDRHVISTVTGDSEISASLSPIETTSSGTHSGRTLTITHASGSATTGFNKLVSDSYGHITSGTPVKLSDLTGLGAVSSARTINTASGLTGGGNLSVDRTIGLVATGTSGTYTKVKTDSYGRVTSGSATIAESDVTNLTTDLAAKVPSSRTITTASGLTGGGDLSTNRTIGLVATGTSGTYTKVKTDSYGRVTSGSATIAESDVTNLTTDLAAKVPSSRTITTASGLTGGGDLSSNLTIGHSNNITAGTAKTSTSSNVTITPTSGSFTTPNIVYDSNGHITTATTDTIELRVNSASSGTAGVVKIATTTGSNNTDTVMTQSAVTKAITDSFAAQDAMVYKGLVGSGTNNGFPTTFSKGATYKVATAFTANSVSYEIGDMFIANTDITTSENFNAAHWDAIQTNLDPTLYVNTARTISGTGALEGGGDLTENRTITHKTLAPSGTSGKTSPNTAQTPKFNKTFTIPVISYDEYGHITATTTTTVTIPNSAATWAYYASGLTVSTATTSNTITLKGSNAAVSGTAIISAATTSAAGLMTKDDKVTLNTLSSMTGVASTLSGITASTTAINSLTGSVGTMAFQNASSYVPTSRKISTGAGLTGGNDLTADRTIKAALSSETKSTLAATAMGSTASRQYAVGLDKNGVLSVNIPWTNENTAYTTSAFTTVSVVGSSTVSVVADKKHDTITLEKDDAITLTGDATNDKVTFGLGNIECGDYA